MLRKIASFEENGVSALSTPNLAGAPPPAVPAAPPPQSSSSFPRPQSQPPPRSPQEGIDVVVQCHGHGTIYNVVQ